MALLIVNVDNMRSKRFGTVLWLKCYLGVSRVSLIVMLTIVTCRLPILDKFKDMGTVVMGKIESGSAREGDSLFVMPNKVLFHSFCADTYSSLSFMLIMLQRD